MEICDVYDCLNFILSLKILHKKKNLNIRYFYLEKLTIIKRNFSVLYQFYTININEKYFKN